MFSRPIITVRGIVYHEGKIFAQRLKSETGINKFWSTPGGKLDVGEDLLSCLEREMIEETGVMPRIGRLLFLQQFIDGDDNELLEFFYHIENSEDYLKIDIDNTTHGLLEVEEFGFIDVKKEAVLPDFLKEVDLPEVFSQAQAVQLFSYLD